MIGNSSFFLPADDCASYEVIPYLDNLIENAGNSPQLPAGQGGRWLSSQIFEKIVVHADTLLL